METTASDGKNYTTTFYNLDAIISVGYRVNSTRATQFRQWCTFVLRQFAIRGYVIDKKRMENGSFIGEDYFEHLLAEIREIRLSERRFYQKLTNIYSTAIDYNCDAPTTRLFFKKVQNKMHYAVHGHTAAELKVSAFLLDLAIRNVKGEITSDEVSQLLNAHYANMPKTETKRSHGLGGDYEILPPDSPRIKEIEEWSRKIRPGLYTNTDK